MSVAVLVPTDVSNIQSSKDSPSLHTFDQTSNNVANRYTLIQLKGFVNNEPMMILFDPCVIHNFMLTLFIKQFNLPVITNIDEVEISNGSIKSTPRNIILIIKIDEYKDFLEFSILKLSSKNDAIIDKP